MIVKFGGLGYRERMDYPQLPEDFPVDEEVKAEIEKLIRGLDLETELKKLVFDGYDNVRDYEKYGEAFVEIRDPAENRTPISDVKNRVLNR